MEWRSEADEEYDYVSDESVKHFVDSVYAVLISVESLIVNNDQTMFTNNVTRVCGAYEFNDLNPMLSYGKISNT